MTSPGTAGDLLSRRPHTTLAGDEDAEDEGDEPDYAPTGSARIDEELASILADAQGADLSLPNYQRLWERLRSNVVGAAQTAWQLHGPNPDGAFHAGTIATSGQQVGSHLTQLYAARHLDVNFTPFSPGPDVIERPGIDKTSEYMRPIREDSLKAQLRRLETLANTDLQLSKTRTLFSAFDEDMTVNRAPIRTYRRNTEGEHPCALCVIASGQLYFTTDLMPIHDNCMCDVEMADEDDISEHEAKYHHIAFVGSLIDAGEQVKALRSLADAGADADAYMDLISTHEHGELGPVIRWAGQKFTGPKDLPDPKAIRPPPAISGPTRTHEARLQSNAARVAQYRRQKAHILRYAEGHGGITTYQPPKSAVDRLAELTTPKPNWTDADLAKEDNAALTGEQRDLARHLATNIWTEGAKVEPAISSAARASTETSGGFMSGWDFRQKTGPSLYRKIQAEAISIANGEPVTEDDLYRAADGIKDAVRYTAVMPEDGYWEKGNQLRKALESLGAKVIKDPAGIPLHGYRGRNMAFTLHGVPFEMQVHTELGVAIKDEAHQIYNVSRKLGADLEAKGLDPAADPTYRKMLDDMQAKWDSMPMLKGTPVVQTEKDAKSGDTNKVMYTMDRTEYQGRTVPGGRAELGSAEMLGRERVPSTRYGLDWTPDSPEAKIVAPARAISDDLWNTLPVQELPPGTPIKANEGTLKKKSIDKVVGGNEPFREGYVIKLFQTDDGQLHVVDGHTRIAMYNALDKPMPVRIMDEHMLQLFSQE